jgi:hypothetical protein
MKNKNKVMVTLEEIDGVWGNSHFGSVSKEDVVKFGLLKCASGYYQGHTSKSILEELGLKQKKRNCLTKRGKFCLFEFFGTISI